MESPPRSQKYRQGHCDPYAQVDAVADEGAEQRRGCEVAIGLSLVHRRHGKGHHHDKRRRPH